MTNVSAAPSWTIEWLESTPSLAIPVYQREYRWKQESCSQLLHDLRAISAAPEGRSHFIGSILTTAEDAGEVTLVDGQQRVTTLMLILAAIRDLAAADDPALASELQTLTLRPGTEMQSRLRPHERFGETLNRLMVGGDFDPGATAFEENYAYFRDQVVDDWRLVWAGIQRLEHVTIGLERNANAQQVFESLNSTGAALSDDELIHNYIHMGRSQADQVALEREVWIPIEEATGGATRSFWRDYLVLTSESQPDVSGDFGIYRAFRRRFTDPQADITPGLGAEWVQYAERYGVLLHPARDEHPEVAHQLSLLKAFEGAPRPLLLGVYRDYSERKIDKAMLIQTLEHVQSMFIRRALVNLDRDIRTIGTICRELNESGYPITGLVRRTPEDPQVRLALTHASVPHAGYVLSRLQNPIRLDNLQVEHIYPQNPCADWSGDGAQRWGDLTTAHQARFRIALQTIGNLTLLEAGLNAGASNRSFRHKADTYYVKSEVTETCLLAERATWDEASIKDRTELLIERFLRTWPRPGDQPMDDPDELTRVVDLERRVAGFSDPDRFEYVIFCGEYWGDVRNIKTLHRRVFTELWRTDPARLMDTESGRSMIHSSRAPNKRYHDLGGGKLLYWGWATQYLLGAVQAVLADLKLDDDVKAKEAELVHNALPDIG